MKKVTSAAAQKVVAIDSEGMGRDPHWPGVTREARLAGRALARLEAEAARIHAEADGAKRGFQAVSSKEGFSCVIKHGRTLIEIQGDDFAVRQSD
jgi:hypothetical protein